jgi:TolB-like protein
VITTDLERIKHLFQEIHRRSLWQALAIYIGASFAALEAVDLLIERIGLPVWFFPIALGLLMVGLPIILVTASVQSGRSAAPAKGQRASEALVDAARDATIVDQHAGLQRLLTWRNALGGGVVAFALWGFVAAVWLLFLGGPPGVSEVAADAQPQLAPTSVAVLYFEDFSQTQDLGYLADGFTEALIHELAQAGALRVISRNGVKPYRDPDIPIDSIARALNVGSLVEGSVERLGDQLRVTVQLIDGADGMHLMSRRVERSGDDLLQLREDVVQEAAWLLRQRLGEEIELRERRAETSSDEAWELVQRAEELRKDSDELWSAGDKAEAMRSHLEADSLLRRAEALDRGWIEPVLLQGWLALELSSRRAPEYGFYDETTALLALEQAERAFTKWPEDPRALAFRGRVRSRLWEQSSDSLVADTLRRFAERDLRLAVEYEPEFAVAWGDLSRLLRKSGEFAPAKLAAQKAYEADAYLADASYILFNLCHISIELKEFEDAARWCEEGQSRFPDHGFFIEPQLVLLASAIGPEPDVDKTWELYDRMMGTYAPQRREGLRPIYMMYVAAVLARAGQEDSARVIIEDAHAKNTSADPNIYYYEANARLRLGEPDEALRLLEAFVLEDPNTKEYLAKDWWWEELWDDPRFMQMVGTQR